MKNTVNVNVYVCVFECNTLRKIPLHKANRKLKHTHKHTHAHKLSFIHKLRKEGEKKNTKTKKGLCVQRDD